jgi:mannose-6-phosphate isomerase-like protein (cupin superfamily)
MKRRITAALWVLTITIAYFAGYAYGPAGSAAADQAAAGQQAAGNQAAGAGRGQPALQGALPPGEHSKISLSPDQGEPFLFAGADLRRYHTELQARTKAGGVGVPTDMLKRTLTRTHSYTMVHRGASASTTPANPEQHEGVTDVYFVVGGSGTVVVGGQIPNRRTVRPGEYAGDPITGGRAFKLAAGDVFNIPPNTPHATMADAGGMTYVLMKVNVGLYPWSLVNGTP